MRTELGSFFEWLIRTSWQAGALVLVVLVVQWLFQRKLSATWRFSLWLLVILRLVLPATPRTSLSIYNWARIGAHQRSAPKQDGGGSELSTDTSTLAPTTREAVDIPPPPERSPGEVSNSSGPQSFTVSSSGSRPATRTAKLLDFNTVELGAAWVWIAGVIVLGVRVTLQTLNFSRRLRSGKAVMDGGILGLLDDCKRALHVRRLIRLVETSAVSSPALFGWSRPTLLLPPHVLSEFSSSEIRCIFLHELAHVKRNDMVIHWLATLLTVVHWFNPLLWVAFRRMVGDRELACDELALSKAGESARMKYGETILKLLESCARPRALPGLVGLLEDREQMPRRMRLIAKFGKRRNWALLGVGLVVALSVVALTDAKETAAARTGQTGGLDAERGKAPTTALPAGSLPEGDLTRQNDSGPRVNLLGEVKTGTGHMLSGATIFISSAAPKKGTSTFCPSCYADCRKSAKTDSAGHFRIESLDPELLFKILVVAKGYKPQFFTKVDPAAKSLSLEMDAVSAGDATPDRRVQGQVVDSQGNPIFGAVVEAEGIRRKNDLGSWGALPGVDPLAVTDEQGQFSLTAKDPFESLSLRVEARAYASRNFAEVSSGPGSHKLTMTTGATVTGRVVFNGKPLPGVSVGVVSTDRSVGKFSGYFDVGTGESGRFSFVNLPPGVDYYIYGLMGTLKPYGAIPIRRIHVGPDDSSLDAGDLPVGRAYRLAGKVALADGARVPPGTRLLIGRESAWDTLQLELDADGHFDTEGLPHETLSLSVNVPGHRRVSSSNASLDPLNPYRLVGQLERDTTNLVFLLERGEEQEPKHGALPPESMQRWNRPLHGAELVSVHLAEHPRQFVLAGRVIDRRTKQPLAAFKITPGESRPMVFWDQVHAVPGTNGTFEIFMERGIAQPLLKIDADGYLPESFDLLPEARTDLEFSLTKGEGPRGRVLNPDGKPALGAQVSVVCGLGRAVSISGSGALQVIGGNGGIQRIGDDGTFALRPEIGMTRVVASSADGFKIATLAQLAANSTLVLERWASLSGVLLRDSAPGTDETLDLRLQDATDDVFLPSALTDSRGHFVFQCVPPGRLQISGRDKKSPMSWQPDVLEKVTASPGQNTEVTIRAGEHPPSLEKLLRARTGQTRPKTVLKPGPGIEGEVFTSGGNPAANAEVALIAEGSFFYLGRATLRADEARREGLVVHSDAAGHFTLPAVEGTHGVFALNEDGYARVSATGNERSLKLILQSWGRIEGVLHVGNRLGTNEMLDLSWAPGSGQPMIEPGTFRAKTDGFGRFIMDLVPPGEQRIARMIPYGPRGWTATPGMLVDVKPGETTLVSVGGGGSTVIGKLRSADILSQADLSRLQAILRTAPPVSLPKSAEEMKKWRTSAEGSAYSKRLRVHPLLLAADGSFRIEEVLPGKYELLGWPDLAVPFDGTPILRKEIFIPEPGASGADTTVDIGIIPADLSAIGQPTSPRRETNGSF